MNKLTVFLLCRNRSKYAEESIESIINQSEKNFKFIISDNSSNRDTHDLVKSKYNDLEYRSWFPGLPVVDHFRKVISSVNTPYFVMFHDDDIMEVDYVKSILMQFEEMPNAVAVGTNGIMIDADGNRIIKNEIGGEFKFTSNQPKKVFVDKDDFMSQYLVGDFGGIAPFCSYAYNADLMFGVLPDFTKSRYFFDAVFLFDIKDKGPIVWLNKPLVRVRNHATSISRSCCNVIDYTGLISIISKESCGSIKRRYIDEYRVANLYAILERRGRGIPYPALKYFIGVAPKLLIFSKTFRRRAMKKFLNRFINISI